MSTCEAWRDEPRTKGPIWAFGPEFPIFHSVTLEGCLSREMG